MIARFILNEIRRGSDSLHQIRVGKTYMMKAWNRIESQGLIRLNDDGTCDMGEFRIHVPIPTLDIAINNLKSEVRDILLECVPVYIPDYENHMFFDIDDISRDVYDALHDAMFDEDNTFNQAARESDITVDNKFRRLYVDEEGVGMMSAFATTRGVESPVMFCLRYR